jgi:hypothetical protein
MKGMSTHDAWARCVRSGLLSLAIMAAAGRAAAADRYVSADAAPGGDGASWATAWSDFDEIDYGALSAGDVVWISGGAAGLSYEATIDPQVSGITFRRSEEPGRDGTVILDGGAHVAVSDVTIDGGDREAFIFSSIPSAYIVHNPAGGERFLFRNATIRGEFADTGTGTPFYSFSAHCTFSRSRIEGTNNEDQIKYNGADGTLIIENSEFVGLTPHGDIHEDIVQFDVPGVTLVARRNRFTTTDTDCFMIASGRCDSGDCYIHGPMEVSYNEFYGMYHAFNMDGAESMTVYNNVFDGCIDIVAREDTPCDQRNNIYTGTRDDGAPVHVIGGAQYCLFDVGTPGFEEGTGNLQADPLFANANNHDYHLLEGSPAADAGIDVALDTDMDGQPIVGAPDIGAHELQATCAERGGTCCPEGAGCAGGDLTGSSDCGSLCCLAGSCQPVPPTGCVDEGFECCDECGSGPQPLYDSTCAVGELCCEACTGPDEDGGPDGGPDGGADGGPDGGTGPDADAGDESDGGCACRAAASGRSGGLASLATALLSLFFADRRRSRGAGRAP